MMKKIYFSLCSILLGSAAIAQNGQIQNGGFENWTNNTLYDYPTIWGSSNQDQFQGVATVLKSTDAQLGTYSAEVRTEVVGPNQDTTFGYVFHGSVGQSGPDGGVPYTAQFNTVKFYYKCDLPAANDSLYLYMIRFLGGTMVEFVAIPAVGGTQSTWTQASINVSSTPQDELFIGFVSGDPNNQNFNSPGSWARVDNVQLYNGASQATAVPDPSFESWSTATLELPDNWYTLDEMLFGMGSPNANKTTDAYAGSYAMEMTTVTANGGQDTIPSFISIGAIDFTSMGMPFMAIPYVANPTTLSGAYKYTGVNGDQGQLQAIWYGNGGSMIGQVVYPFPDQATYTTFSTPLTITGTPDSLVLFAYSGNNPLSVLYLDELSFSGNNVGLEEFSNSSLSIYPNPAREKVMIKLDGTFNYELIDLSGKTLASGINLTNAVEIQLNDFNAGSYIIRLTNDNKVETHQLIIE